MGKKSDHLNGTFTEKPISGHVDLTQELAEYRNNNAIEQLARLKPVLEECEKALADKCIQVDLLERQLARMIDARMVSYSMPSSIKGSPASLSRASSQKSLPLVPLPLPEIVHRKNFSVEMLADKPSNPIESLPLRENSMVPPVASPNLDPRPLLHSGKITLHSRQASGASSIYYDSASTADSIYRGPFANDIVKLYFIRTKIAIIANNLHRAEHLLQTARRYAQDDSDTENMTMCSELQAFLTRQRNEFEQRERDIDHASRARDTILEECASMDESSMHVQKPRPTQLSHHSSSGLGVSMLEEAGPETSRRLPGTAGASGRVTFTDVTHKAFSFRPKSQSPVSAGLPDSDRAASLESYSGDPSTTETTDSNLYPPKQIGTDDVWKISDIGNWLKEVAGGRTDGPESLDGGKSADVHVHGFPVSDEERNAADLVLRRKSMG